MTGSTAAPTETVTSEAPPSVFDLVTPPAEPPPFEEVTITTNDEEPIDVYAKYWAGDSTAVLYTHHFQPVWIVHIDVGSTGGIPTRLEPHVANLYETFLFPRVPSGLQFIDVYGPEYGGRQLAFIDYVEQNG